jgi:hypothetical protein
LFINLHLISHLPIAARALLINTPTVAEEIYKQLIGFPFCGFAAEKTKQRLLICATQ